MRRSTCFFIMFMLLLEYRLKTNMRPIEIIYILTTLVSLTSSVPQITQLIAKKSSSELNVFTWVIWFIAQIIATIYAYYIKATAYFFISSTWVIFYLIMMTLIIRYRSPKFTKLANPSVCLVEFGPGFTPVSRH